MKSSVMGRVSAPKNCMKIRHTLLIEYDAMRNRGVFRIEICTICTIGHNRVSQDILGYENTSLLDRKRTLDRL